jgi:23S rRNA (cytosine1962-C5)-methyltransferase
LAGLNPVAAVVLFSMPASVRLKPGKEKSLLRRHPWVFSGAVAHLQGEPAAGDTLAVISAKGDFLGWGAYSPHSQIRVRIWAWEQPTRVDADFFYRRLQGAIAARQSIPDLQAAQALRLVHGESDGLPGLIVDRYADTLVLQCLSSGPEAWLETIADQLCDLTGCRDLYERSDVDVRQLEGLPERVGPLRGSEPPDRIHIREGQCRYAVDVRKGHKTGFYLDQRLNRLRVGQLAAGQQALDCFSYSGGFAVAMLANGAQSVLRLDASQDALALGDENLALNGFDPQKSPSLQGDVFQVLRTFRDQGRSFDLIVLDPPKFAPTAAQAQRAARGYKDINLLAFKLLRPGGFLATFSCSGGIDAGLFQKIVAGAALDAGVQAHIIDRLQQGPDHPVALNFPEGAYLKGLVLRVSA